MHFNKACCLNPCWFCYVRSPASRYLWLSGKNLGNNMRSSSPGRKLAYDGQRNTIFEWMIQMHMSLQCVSLQYLLQCCSNLRPDWNSPQSCYTLLLDPSWMGTSLYLGSKRYNFKACKSIPLFSSVLSHDSQMCWYYNQKSSTSKAATTDPPMWPTLVSRVKLAQMQFKVQDSIYNKKFTNDKFSVEVEFQKYILGSTLSKETNIL